MDVCSVRRWSWRMVVVTVGGLPLKLTPISFLRPWVLLAPGGSSVGWICRSFHGPLIFKMGLWSGQWEVSRKYRPDREHLESGYQRLPMATRETPFWKSKNAVFQTELASSQCEMKFTKVIAPAGDTEIRSLFHLSEFLDFSNLSCNLLTFFRCDIYTFRPE